MTDSSVMARKVTSMKLIAAVTAFVAGEPMNVTAVCRDAGCAPKTFYKWADRYRREGLDGFTQRSRRPKRSPGQSPVWVEELVVAYRVRLAGQGLDHGATTIQWHLGHDPAMATVTVPSTATIHRILRRRGLVADQPEKRPKGSWRRFEAPAPNEWWQIDAMDWVIATGVVKVFNIIDDHSRVVVRSRAVTNATSAEAWTTFGQGAQRWGLPAGVLSDNGLCFSGKLKGFEVEFEANLRKVGVRPFTGRVFHPQTTGKVERFQQTLKRWLRAQPLARDLTQLQAQLDEFCELYNHHRPHQGIGRQTPAARWHATTASGPTEEPLPHPDYRTPTIHHARVEANGIVQAGRNLRIHIGTEHATHDATIIVDRHHASVFINDHLVRHLVINPNRRYHPGHLAS